MKIEFDEGNKLVVTAIATMLNTIAGNENVLGIVEETKTVTAGDASVTTTTKTPTKSGNDLPPPDLNDDLDSDRMPWDGRINSKTKTKNADLTWKILRRPKKQFDTDEAWKAFIATVKTELKGNDSPPANDFGGGSEPEPEMSFAILMKLVTGSGGKITPEDLQEICDSYEIAQPSDLGKMENKILLPSIYEELQEILSE